MAMTYVQMQDSILHQLGDFSSTTREKVKRWINDTRNTIWEQVPGQHQEDTDYLTTSESYDSTSVITVAVTNGSTTITSDGSTNTVFTAAMVGRYIRLDGSPPWYRIASRTSATEIELEDDYIGDTDTGVEFKIHTWTWPVSSSVQRLLQVTVEDEDNWTPLRIIDRIDFYNTQPLPLRWDDDTPEVCFLDEDDASGNMLMGIWPVPASATLIRYRYQVAVTELSSDSDVIGIPGADMAVKAGTLMEAYTWRSRMNEAALWYQRYEQELDRLKMTVGRSALTSFRRRDRTDAGSGGSIGVNMGSGWPR